MNPNGTIVYHQHCMDGYGLHMMSDNCHAMRRVAQTVLEIMRYSKLVNIEGTPE